MSQIINFSNRPENLSLKHSSFSIGRKTTREKIISQAHGKPEYLHFKRLPDNCHTAEIKQFPLGEARISGCQLKLLDSMHAVPHGALVLFSRAELISLPVFDLTKITDIYTIGITHLMDTRLHLIAASTRFTILDIFEPLLKLATLDIEKEQAAVLECVRQILPGFHMLFNMPFDQPRIMLRFNTFKDILDNEMLRRKAFSMFNQIF